MYPTDKEQAINVPELQGISVQTSVYLPKTLIKWCKSQGVTLRQLCLRGFLSLGGDKQVVARVKELEETALKQSRALTRMQTLLLEREYEPKDKL